MKIVIPKQEIERVLVKSVPFLESKDLSMMTSNVMISLDDGVMTINATNYELGIKTVVRTMGIVTDGASIVNGKKLLDVIKILKNDNVTIESKDDIMFVSQGRSKFKIALFSDTNFPKFPSIEDNKEMIIDSCVMIEAFRLITPTIDINNPKYEFNGALSNIESDCINFISSDTKRLSVVSAETKSENELSIIIPKVAIIEIQKLFNDDDIKIFCDSTYMIIQSDNITFFTKLINGKYPDVKRVIPKEVNNNIEVNKLEMIGAIKQIKTVSEEIKITIENNKIVFSSIGDTKNEAVTDINIDFETSESFTMAAQSKYLLDFLNVIFADTFTIGVNEESMPFVLESGDLKTIVMPIVT